VSFFLEYYSSPIRFVSLCIQGEYQNESLKIVRLAANRRSKEIAELVAYIQVNDMGDREMDDAQARAVINKATVAVFDKYESYQYVDYETGKFSTTGKVYKGKVMVMIQNTLPEFTDTFIWNERRIMQHIERDGEVKFFYQSLASASL